MRKNFNITDYLSDATLRASSQRFLANQDKNQFRKIDVRKLRPAAGDKNFYHVSQENVNAIAASIELLGEIQENLVVRPVSGTDEYEVIAGNTRRMAVMQLVNEGKEQYAMVPCKILTEDTDSIEEELVLILTNSTQRIRSDAEKMYEIDRLRQLIIAFREQHEGVFQGNIQKIIADILHISKSKVGRLDNINRNLTGDLKQEFENGNINVSVANELAGLPVESQNAFYERIKEDGNNVSMRDVYLEKIKEVPEADEPEKPVVGSEEMEENETFSAEISVNGMRSEETACLHPSQKDNEHAQVNTAEKMSPSQEETVGLEKEDDSILRFEQWFLQNNDRSLHMSILRICASTMEDELRSHNLYTEKMVADIVDLLANRLSRNITAVASDYREYILKQISLNGGGIWRNL